MMKRVLIAAAAAAVLATSALTGAAPASAAETAATNLIQVHGPGDWNGRGNWHKGPDRWHGGGWQGPPKWKARKSCDPIVRKRLVGPPWHKRWERVVVGWDCDWHKKRWH